MANKRLRFGMLVMALAFGLTLVGCPGGGTAIDGITVHNFTLDEEDYTSVFGTAPAGFEILTGSKEELVEKAEDANDKSVSSNPSFVVSGGLSDENVGYATIEKYYLEYWGFSSMPISSAHKTEFMNTLKSKGYCVMVQKIYNNAFGVVAAYEE